MSKGFGNLMRQAQAMQKKMAVVQEEMENVVVEGEAGQGKVTAQVSCGMNIKAIKVAPELIDPDDPEMLEDMLAVAVNDALQKAREHREKEMSKVTGGMAPGIF